ncbi:hypothetical protein [Deinococcus aluminii]|uniref:Uncharacterized protein n=1 Tax=Deinococcus aluminii TaxID=1656885 RepID=A0ABP9XH84_9DEIO
MSITDLTELTRNLEHVALVQLYLQHFEAGFLAGSFDAIPGKEITLKVGKQSLTTTSYAVLADERFQKWQEATVQAVQDFTVDETKVASRENCADLTPEMFALLAAKARESRGVPDARKKARRKETAQAQTPVGAVPTQGEVPGAQRELAAS